MSLADDEATMRTCGLSSVYNRNKAAFDLIARVAYQSLCHLRSRAAQQANNGPIGPPTLPECQDHYYQLLPLFPVFQKLKINGFLKLSATQSCHEAFARYVVGSNWSAIVNQNSCP